MRRYLTSTFYLLLISGCVTSQSNSNGENPLDVYRTASVQTNRSPDDYSLEYLKSQAALYLLSQGKTDLKSGNSIRAIQRFSEARKLNPWNDEIKDFYILSVKTLVRVTNRLQNEKCEIINDRLGFIYSVASDQMTEVQSLVDKCDFKIGAASTEEFHSLPLSEKGNEIQKNEFENLNEEISKKIKKNKYVPRKELLFLGLSYLADLKIELGKPLVGSENDDTSSVRILFPIATKYTGKTSVEEYCEKAKGLLRNMDYEQEVDFTPVREFNEPGRLKCRVTGYASQDDFLTLPSWKEKIGNIWPLPKDIIVDFVLYYENGKSRSYRDVVSILASPHQIDSGIGMKFMYTKGELPFVLKYSRAKGSEKRYVLRGEDDLLEFLLPAHVLNGLKKVAVKIDLKETFKDSYDENYKSRGRHGPGGIIFDN